jgi:hypothetical protein
MWLRWSVWCLRHAVTVSEAVIRFLSGRALSCDFGCRTSFLRQVNRRTGHRLKHKLVDSVTGEAIDASDKARGYEIGENEFLFVEDRDLAQAARPASAAVRFRLPNLRSGQARPLFPARAPELPEQDLKRRALLNHFPGAVYAPATLAAFSAMPLNSLGVQARTVSILDIEPLAATAIPVATASDPSAASVMSTTSFEPVVKYIAINLPPAFSTNALITPERSEGLSTSPFVPEWE